MNNITTKKTKKVTFKGVTKEIEFYKGKLWFRHPTIEMEKYKKETGKNPVINDRITGTFEYWLYWKKPNEKLKSTKKQYDIIKEYLDKNNIDYEEKITNRYRNITVSTALNQFYSIWLWNKPNSKTKITEHCWDIEMENEKGEPYQGEYKRQTTFKQMKQEL